MDKREKKEIISVIVKLARYIIFLAIIALGAVIVLVIYLFSPPSLKVISAISGSTALVDSDVKLSAGSTPRSSPIDVWKAPDISTQPPGKAGEMIRYGKELISSTAKYLGPQGSVAHITNGMNCQNCHLNAGTKLFSNNFAGFMSSYPKLSGRSGKGESASQRISECFERSLNGMSPDTNKKEIQAILAYMIWVGRNVKKGRKLSGSSTEKLIFIDQPTDPVKGKMVYLSKCESCHGKTGEGILAQDKISYINPPLWGTHSYNDGAGMYRVINFAGFVKNNMPYGATYQNPQLTNEEAWNVAAFVNSQPRPHKDQKNDYPDLTQKPLDFPFGPYADQFSAKQHKYGPYDPIIENQKTLIHKKD